MFNMTLEEIREGMKEMSTVILPIGCTEQHGYHLPISTDILTAVEIAARTSDLCGCFVAPPINYSYSGGLLSGTINISPQLCGMLVKEICGSLVLMGFRNVIVLLGHGGSENTAAVKEAIEDFLRDPRIEGVRVLLVPFWELSPSYMKAFEEQDYHAGKYETSMMLYWRPEMVHLERARLDSQEDLDAHRAEQEAAAERWKNDVRFSVHVSKWGKRIKVGVWGHLDGISADLGRAIADESSQELARIIREMEENK